MLSMNFVYQTTSPARNVKQKMRRFGISTDTNDSGDCDSGAIAENNSLFSCFNGILP